MEAADIEGSRLESLGDRRQIGSSLSQILQLRGKERMEAILSSPNPHEIFQSLPEEEAYVTIKEIGEQDALPLLSLMSAEQCQYLMDLELWRGFEIDTGKIERWLPLLLSCDDEAIGRWLQGIDVDTLLLILKKTVRIHLAEREESDPARDEEKPYFTLDGTYYIEILYPSLQNAIEHLLRQIADADLHLYWKVLSQVQWEIGAELEERTLHFREARLEDKGFPTMEEALSLYQYLTPERLKRMLERKEIYPTGTAEERVAPSFPMVLKDQTTYFSLCLRDIAEGPLMDRVKMELTRMANQVMVAERPESIDLPTIQGSLRKVGGYLSIGLELLAEGNPQRAKEWIEQTPLKFIFQVGFGTTLELKWRAERIWRSPYFRERKVPLSFLGSPWEERMRGLFKKRPLFYEEPEMAYREFRSLQEVRSVHRDLDKIESVGKALSSLPAFSYSEGLIWQTVLLEAFLRDQTGSFSQEKPMALEEAQSWLRRLCEEKKEIEELLMTWLLQKIGPEAEPNLVRELAKAMLGQ